MIVLAGVVLIFISSCSKQLDTFPRTRLVEITTFEDLKSALLGAYDGFQSNNYYGNPAASGTASGWSGLPELMGDDFVEAFESLGNWNVMSEMIYSSDNGQAGAIFAQPYEIISRANNVLNALVSFENGPNANEVKQIKAQALAIRAHAHFDLLRYFASEFDRNSSKPGVPYVTTFDPQDPFGNLPARNTVKEDYDAIFIDLNNALTAFNESGDLADNPQRYYIDKTVIYAIRARVNYYASQWNDVIADASSALASRPVGDPNDYIYTFLNPSNSTSESDPPDEVYWAIPSDGTFRPGGAISGTNPAYRVTASMTSIIQNLGGVYTNSNINRFNMAGIGGIQRTICWKYPGIRSFKVYRAGEMLLMMAEAKQRTGNSTAIDDLNELRTHRGLATGMESGAALLDAILTLRRVELLGEGHRWFDIRRTTRSIVRAECGTSGGSRADNCTIDPSSRSWTFPIPFNEIKVNPNLVQNEGY